MKKIQRTAMFARRAGFDRKLLGYSATAGAALALAPSAEAQIKTLTLFSYDNGSTFTSTPPDTTVAITLRAATANHTLTFNFGLLRANPYYVAIANHSALGIAANAVNGSRALLLASGVAIAGHPFNPNGQQVLATAGHGFSFTSRTGYIGFKGSANGHNYYGWLRAKVTGNTEVALVSKAGQPWIFGAVGLASSGITAGQVPEPATVATGLALFALGAAGVRAHRRRRQLAV